MSGATGVGLLGASWCYWPVGIPGQPRHPVDLGYSPCIRKRSQVARLFFLSTSLPSCAALSFTALCASSLCARPPLPLTERLPHSSRASLVRRVRHTRVCFCFCSVPTPPSQLALPGVAPPRAGMPLAFSHPRFSRSSFTHRSITILL